MLVIMQKPCFMPVNKILYDCVKLSGTSIHNLRILICNGKHYASNDKRKSTYFF